MEYHFPEKEKKRSGENLPEIKVCHSVILLKRVGSEAYYDTSIHLYSFLICILVEGFLDQRK